MCNALRNFDEKSWKPDGIVSPPLSAKSQELEPCKFWDISQTICWTIIHWFASFFHPSIHPSIRPSIQPSVHLSPPLLRRWWRLHFQGCTEVSASSPPPSSNHTWSILPHIHILTHIHSLQNYQEGPEIPMDGWWDENDAVQWKIITIKDRKSPDTDDETRMTPFDEKVRKLSCREVRVTWSSDIGFNL